MFLPKRIRSNVFNYLFGFFRFDIVRKLLANVHEKWVVDLAFRLGSYLPRFLRWDYYQPWHLGHLLDYSHEVLHFKCYLGKLPPTKNINVLLENSPKSDPFHFSPNLNIPYYFRPDHNITRCIVGCILIK
jgi:hypothetical protein